jgi:DnaJ family protein C protein 8
VKKSYALLDDDNTRKKCFEIVEEARGRTGQNMQEKRKKMQKDAKAKGLPPTGDHMKVITSI